MYLCLFIITAHCVDECGPSFKFRTCSILKAEARRSVHHTAKMCRHSPGNKTLCAHSIPIFTAHRSVHHCHSFGFASLKCLNLFISGLNCFQIPLNKYICLNRTQFKVNNSYTHLNHYEYD